MSNERRKLKTNVDQGTIESPPCLDLDPLIAGDVDVNRIILDGQHLAQITAQIDSPRGRWRLEAPQFDPPTTAFCFQQAYAKSGDSPSLYDWRPVRGSDVGGID